jgi:peptide/nickel transport system substrate-binding protein
MYGKKIVYYTISLIAILSMLLAACQSEPEVVVTEEPVAETEAPAVEAEEPIVETEEPVVATEEPVVETPKKVLTLIWTQEFDSLNPLYSNMWFSIVTQQIWLSWAWEFDQSNTAFPKLVTEIPSVENGGISEDGRVITMHLRDDLLWSDGTPLTADDFVFTAEMAINPANTVASTYPYDNIESITAPDPQTVSITFFEPFAPWLATMWHGVLPAHILRPVYEAEGTIDSAEWNMMPNVGCGPYVLANWESGSFAQFVRNENYWGDAPLIDEIFFLFVPDDASQVAALLAGDGDIGTFIAVSDVPALQDAGINIVTEPSGYQEGLFFLINEELGHPALVDVRVRQAIAMGIDREAINQDLLLGLTNVPASFWDALPYYNDPPLENYPYDPTAAAALLDEAGWIDSNGDGIRDKDGVELELVYATTIREIRQDTQAVIQQQLAEIGIAVDILSYDADLYFSGYGDGPAASGEVDIMEWSDGPIFPDADVYYWLCSEIPSDDYPDGTNWFFMCDQELSDLIELQSTQVNAEERQQTISQINQIFYERVYWLGLWQDPDVWAVGPQVLNFLVSGVTPFYSIVEWDLSE